MFLPLMLATKWLTCALVAGARELGPVGGGATPWTGGDMELGGPRAPPGGEGSHSWPLIHLSVIYKGNSSNQVRWVSAWLGEGEDGKVRGRMGW